ncbi:MAG: pitrilysin family protein [Burkholderiales bacterium]
MIQQTPRIFARPVLLAVIALLTVVFATQVHAALPIQHWMTSGGARVYFVAARTLPILDVSVEFAAGSSRDAADRSGVASLTAGLMNNGAGGLSEDEISTRIANIGAMLGGNFDQDRAGWSARTLSSEREREEAISLLATIVQQPEFPEAILEREKAQLISALRQSNSDADSVAERQFYKILYQDHPYSQKPTETSLKPITRDDLVAFYRRYYTVDHAVVSLIGDVSRAEAEAIAERLTSKLPKSESAFAELAPVKIPSQPMLKEVPFPSTQSHIMLGYPGIKRIDPDYFPLLVGNYVLGGGGFASRLTNEVREKRGLVYSVSSYFMPMADLGPYRVSLQTRKDQTKEALQVVRDTIKDFIGNGPTEEELANAKRNLGGGFPLRIDSNRKIFEYLQLIGFYKLPLTFLDDYVAKVEKVTVAEIKDAFKRRIVPDNMVTVVVGLPETSEQKAEAKQ